VHVSVIMPGAVDTAITANSGVPAPGGVDTAADAGGMPITSAEKAARIMVDGIMKDRLYIYVGLDARLMNLAIRLAPKPAIRFVKEQMAKRLGSLQPTSCRTSYGLVRPVGQAVA
jgi:short-subunit dehydrogenase